MPNKVLMKHTMDWFDKNRDKIAYAVSYETFREEFEKKKDMKRFWKDSNRSLPGRAVTY